MKNISTGKKLYLLCLADVRILSVTILCSLHNFLELLILIPLAKEQAHVAAFEEGNTVLSHDIVITANRLNLISLHRSHRVAKSLLTLTDCIAAERCQSCVSSYDTELITPGPKQY